MTTPIPEGYMHIVQPVTDVTGRRWTTTYGVQPASTGAVDRQAAINACQAAYNANIRAVTDSSFIVQKPEGYCNIGGGTLTLSIATGAAVAGAVTKSSAPCSVTPILRKRTAFVGRRYRGRMYLPVGLAEADVDEVGALTVGSLGSYNTAAAAFLSALTSSLTGMILFGRDPFDGDPTANAVTSLTVAPVCGTQRRRLAR